MSKVAQYLNEHILGEVTVDTAVRKHYATDASIMTITPEMVAYPRTTNDIRKIMRFTHQLAIKGHTIQVGPRGAGSDRTGAALTDGISIVSSAHLRHIYEFDAKQRLVRLQPGVTVMALNEALKLQGCYVPLGIGSASYASIGGSVANNASGSLSGKYGAIEDYVRELEVVLANGDVIQTRRLNKRELNQKLALQTFEGEIYRAVDQLLDEQSELIAEINPSDIDNSGYAGLARVRTKQGFDLTPLFVGSQGTLGIISELILGAEYYNDDSLTMAIAVESSQVLHDVSDELRKLNPDNLDVYDSGMFVLAQHFGKQYRIFTEATADNGICAGVITCTFRDFNQRHRTKKLKRAMKVASRFTNVIHDSTNSDVADELRSLGGVLYSATQTTEKGYGITSLFTGVHIPNERFEDFDSALRNLEKAHGVLLPYSGHLTDGTYSYWPKFSLHTAADKQKMLKLYGEFASLVVDHGGSLAAESGEGRVKAAFSSRSAELRELDSKVKAIFDQHGVLNSGVKTDASLKSVVARLRSSFDGITGGEMTGL
jgi:FAD/FMN-containing dehydrogenase